jgi:hypothetical protein
MATNTYVQLDKVTVGTATPSVTFTSISGAYTDLVIVANIRGSANTFNNMNYPLITFNNDTGANYSATLMFERYYGAQQTLGDRSSGQNNLNLGAIAGPSHSSNIFSTYTLQVPNYANTTTYKTCLARISTGGGLTDMQGASLATGLWRSTSAVTSVTFTASSSGNFAVGSTLSLYGIRAEGVSPAPKATGGAIYDDETYYYHAFGASGTFTPTQSITADVLVVAGGGGGGGYYIPAPNAGGGGGAGGLLYFASQSLTATNYTCTIGAGGSGGGSSANGVNGGDSQFGSLTLVKGGGYGALQSNGGNGGSGGGAGGNGGTSYTGGTQTSGQGYAGGNSNTGQRGTGSGGGAGGAGVAGPFSGAGATGGVGLSTYSSWSLATGVGQNVSGTYYIAGGGGCGQTNFTTASLGGNGGGGNGVVTGAGENGLTNAGGGGAGSACWDSGNGNGGNGGSGVVIVRYAKV